MKNSHELIDDSDVLIFIQRLVNEEQNLLDLAKHSGLTEEQHMALGQLAIHLDQCWDLLRQRRARRKAGLDPGDARLHDAEGTERFPQ